MATVDTRRDLERKWKEWRASFRAVLAQPVSDEEKARQRAETKPLLAFRDSLPRIAPDPTEQYIDEIRQEAEAPLGSR